MCPDWLLSTASESAHEPGLPSLERATHTRVPATTLISIGCPVAGAAHPPASNCGANCAARVVNTAYTSPLRRSTKMSLGPPESPHWRSLKASEPGAVIGTGGVNVAPPSGGLGPNLLWFPEPPGGVGGGRGRPGLPAPRGF